MRTVRIAPNFGAWREAARELLQAKVSPAEILWNETTGENELFTEEPVPHPTPLRVVNVPSAVLELARMVAAPRDARRWAWLYRVLWRLVLGGESRLLSIPTDADVRQLEIWRKAVSRDIHKMHAFVRFRLVGHDAENGHEQFVAWFVPEHCIMRLGTPFFQKRFTGMDWSILTPDECAHWDGVTLHFTPGVAANMAPAGDALEDLWRTYYRSIFNPARLKIKAMQAEMPKKYWKNLPEAKLIDELIAQSNDRVEAMLQETPRPAKPAPKNAYLEQLKKRDETT